MTITTHADLRLRVLVIRLTIIVRFGDVGALALPDDWSELKFCDACRRHTTESIAAGRKKLWDELPAIFDLPPWDESKNNI
ncbi:hypothetical protein B0H12DRAFT_1247043 [Mycena haematopus]|nr:hypothetical protein B0H12DRAFT_1247043 [Mycena haematopus]